MEIYISERRSDTNGIIVQFTSRLGNGIGQWMGPPSQPEIHAAYYVEFSTAEEADIWGKNVKDVDLPVDKLQVGDDGRMVLQGKIEDLDREQDCCVIRLGDSLFIIGTSRIPRGIGEFVRVETERLLIYNEDI